MSNTAHFSLTVFVPVHIIVSKKMRKKPFQTNPIQGVFKHVQFRFGAITSTSLENV